MIAVFNLAGGVGSNSKRPGKPDCPVVMGKVFAAAAPKVRVPTLWIYAKNDVFWGQTLPNDWHKAFVSAGGKAEFVPLKAVDGDGHSEISNSVHLWHRNGDAFLAKIGFAAASISGAPEKTVFATLDDTTRLPSKLPGAMADYEKFLQADLPRAFVIAPDGKWAFRQGRSTSLQDALNDCEVRATVRCKAYAVDDAIVWGP